MKRTAELLSFNVKAIRTAKGWTQEELAINADLPFDVVQRAEAASHFPRGPRLTKLADALGVPESRLFQEPEGPIASLPNPQQKIVKLVLSLNEQESEQILPTIEVLVAGHLARRPSKKK